MNETKEKHGEEIEKVYARAGDVVVIKYKKYHRPLIKVFSEVNLS